MKKIVCAALLLATLITGTACDGSSLRGETAAAIDGVTVNGAVMEYYFNDIYYTYITYYKNNLSAIGLDTDKSLHDQKREDGTTWHDYFEEATKNWAERLILLNKAAADEGITLSDAEITAIKSRMKTIDKGIYGMADEDIYEAKCIEALAYKYQGIKEAEFAPTDAEVAAELEKSPESYTYIDYLAFPISYADDGSAPFTKAEAKALADELAATKNKTEYNAIVGKIMLMQDASTTPEAIAERVERAEYTGRAYRESSLAFKWAFGGAKVNETYISEGTSGTMYTVYMLLSEPYLMKEETINVRYIILDPNVFGGEDGAQKLANEIVKKLDNVENGAEVFSNLALEYSSDAATYYMGGKYSDLKDGSIDETINKWCFDPERKVGDVTAIKTDAGMNILMFDGKGVGTSRAKIVDAIVSERINSILDEISKNHTVTFDDDVMDKLGS